jgi:branched-chain amino acid transport system substrate-binding protein
MSSSPKLNRRVVIKGAVAAGAATLLSPAALAQQTPIKIGFGMSLTGGLAGGGKQSLLAFEIWRDAINAKGGLLGRPVQLVHYDDQSNPANVPGLYAKLIDIDKVDLVVSAYATNQITPAMPIAMQKNLVYMGLFGTDVNAKFNYDRYFSTVPNGPDGKRAPTLGFLEVAAGLNPKPQTIALVAADAEYAQTVIAGARETVGSLGFKAVYDRSYPPSTVDYTPIVRAVAATNPDIICIASYPPDSVGLIRAANEIGVKPRVFGGAMIGLGFTPIKAQLGPLLNGIVNYDTYVPEPTMQFPGVDAFLKTYQEKAPGAGVDLHGFFLPPFAYAQMQVLAQAVSAAGSLDHAKLAAELRKGTFDTIVGEVKFGPNGEWQKNRTLTIQFQGVQAGDVNQFKQPGKAVILHPNELKSGSLIEPYVKARGAGG